jgi:hypothetical protein
MPGPTFSTRTHDQKNEIPLIHPRVQLVNGDGVQFLAVAEIIPDDKLDFCHLGFAKIAGGQP